MARAGLAEPHLRMLRAVVADGGTVARFRAKIAVVPGSGCEYWTSAISGRSYGRYWVGTVAGRDVVMRTGSRGRSSTALIPWSRFPCWSTALTTPYVNGSEKGTSWRQAMG